MKASLAPCFKRHLGDGIAIDKLTRSTMDGMTGILYTDDAQVVDDEHHKVYGTPECVHISVQLVEEP